MTYWLRWMNIFTIDYKGSFFKVWRLIHIKRLTVNTRNNKMEKQCLE